MKYTLIFKDHTERSGECDLFAVLLHEAEREVLKRNEPVEIVAERDDGKFQRFEVRPKGLPNAYPVDRVKEER